jgi:hypothetical protein
MTPLFTFTSVRQSFLSTSFVPVSTILCGTHTLSHTHTIVCVWVCECACVTHTHTLTHTPAPQTTCLIDTFCAQKKFTFVKLFYQVFKPSWYLFLSTTNLVLLSPSSIPCWLYLFLFAQKIPQNFVLLVFFGRKNRQTSVLYQTDIVNKYLFFILFYKSQVIFPFCFFYSNTVFPTSVTPSGHYSVSKKIFFKCCTNKSDCSYLYCNVDFIVRSVVFYCESPNLL